MKRKILESELSHKKSLVKSFCFSELWNCLKIPFKTGEMMYWGKIGENQENTKKNRPNSEEKGAKFQKIGVVTLNACQLMINIKQKFQKSCSSIFSHKTFESKTHKKICYAIQPTFPPINISSIFKQKPVKVQEKKTFFYIRIKTARLSS